ncbi:hypothetical protein NLM27_27405 [Bradyrhizobium sp. CCGB12]|uniref:DUF6538 domain-containing protein n=1 Tax=Bradyrhizobium sp. CCGB12 TaxID=2949632 RepID=UPI0020B17D3B|nr:DUF6538 domain-containing protein [Bradyrhizobium sp. CCGB12]MCP3392476.1 hypothetical protein [Bradyrhizobium sp. CCGB12]
MPYLIKNSAGVWCVQRKVPQKLEVAVARVVGAKKNKQAYLKKSLGTKDRREVSRRAVHVLADLDRTLREAEALIKREPKQPKAPLRDTLNDAEIKRMAEYVYAKTLAWDERCRYRATTKLLEIAAEHGITRANVLENFKFEFVMPSELIRLTQPSMPTPNTPRVAKLRSDVAELNAFFAKQTLTPPTIKHLGWIRMFHGYTKGYQWNKGGRLYSQPQGQA